METKVNLEDNVQNISRGYSLIRAAGNLAKIGGVAFLTMAGAAIPGCDLFSGSKTPDSKQMRAAREKVEQVGEKFTEDAEEIKKTVNETYGDLKKHDAQQDEERGKLGERVDGIEQRTTANEDVTAANQEEIAGLRDKDDSHDKRFETQGERLKETRRLAEKNKDRILDSPGTHYDYRSGHSLEREVLEDGRERVTVFKDGNPIQILTIKKYRGGDMDILNMSDANKNGQFEDNERKGGLYSPAAAEAEIVKLDSLIRNLEKEDKKKPDVVQLPGGPAELAVEFHGYLRELSKIGTNPTSAPLDDRARDIVEFFRDAESKGKHSGSTMFEMPDSYSAFERTDLSVGETESGKRYHIYAGNSMLMSVELTDNGFDVTDFAIRDPAKRKYSVEAPSQYVDEVASAFAAANKRGKEKFLEEQRKEAERKKTALEEENKEAREKELREDYDRGVQAETEAGGGRDYRAEARASLGNESGNIEVEGFHERSTASAEDGESRDKKTTFGRARGELRLGEPSKGRSANRRTRIGIDISGQFEREDSLFDSRDAESEIDDSGRFETTEEYFGGEEAKKKSFGSVGIDLHFPSMSVLKFVGYGGFDSDKLKEDYRFTIVDVTGAIPDPIVNDVNIDTNIESTMWGAEFLGGLGAADGRALLMALAGIEGGHIVTDDGTRLSYDNFIEGRLGAFGDFYPADRINLQLGGVYSFANVEGDETHQLDLSLSGVFGSKYLLLSPSFGGTAAKGETPRFEGGALLAIGGSGENSSQNAWAVGQYNLDRMLRENSRQFTEEGKDFLDEQAWHNLLRDIDTTVLLNVNLANMHDSEGKRMVGARADGVVMIPAGDGKFIIGGYYKRVPEGHVAGGKAGYYNDWFFGELGAEYRHGKLLNPDGNEDGGRGTAGVGFRFG